MPIRAGRAGSIVDFESFPIDKDLAGRETATGVIPTALRPIFRDRDDFTAGKTLAEQTQAALDASAALIVVCSPAAAKSHYVNEEIRLFKSRYPTRPVVPLIVGGKPDDAKSECFPPALKFKLDADGQPTIEADELLAADAQEEGDGKNLALAKVVAGLTGVSSDEIFRRADRERRAALRRRRRVQGVFALLVVLLTVGGLLWLEGPYLKEQYHWFTAMGPRVLRLDGERALKPGSEFAECTGGCPTMVVVPAGKFMMGSADGVGLDTEHPQHEVTIAKPFAVSKYEVTSCRVGRVRRCWRLSGNVRYRMGARQAAGHQCELGRCPTIRGVAVAAHRQGLPAALRGRVGICGAGRHHHRLFFWRRRCRAR